MQLQFTFSMTKRTQKRTFSNNKYILIVIGFTLIIGATLFLNYYNETKKLTPFTECEPSRYANVPISPSSILNDKNEIHLLHAQTNGLKHVFTTDSDFNANIDSLVFKLILMKVTNNRFYQLKELTHSEPYLIPEAADLLNQIGYRFQKRLEEKKYNPYQFRITSLLRTEETQGKLSHRNRNATSHSAHLYGTTVDISYKNFYNVKTDTIESSYEAVQTLTAVLIEMRQECKLLAVRERHQSCFHITVVLCKPTGQ